MKQTKPWEQDAQIYWSDKMQLKRSSSAVVDARPLARANAEIAQLAGTSKKWRLLGMWVQGNPVKCSWYR